MNDEPITKKENVENKEDAVTLSKEVFQAIINYLGSKPFIEVAPIFNALNIKIEVNAQNK